MDVVIQFAMHKLGFQLTDIMVYAWSIGGFTGTERKNNNIGCYKLESCYLVLHPGSASLDSFDAPYFPP